MPTPAWTEHPDLVAFYRKHRNQPEDLYPSERRFLPWLAAQAESVLDVGCAAGGFAAIWLSYNAAVRYRGVDRSPALVAGAGELHPESSFLVGDCAEGLPLPDGSATVVQALGWLHWEPRYREALAELWRLAGRYAFFDVRLVDRDDDAVGQQRLALVGEWDGATTTPYICLSWRRFAAELLSLGAARILGHGYFGSPADTVAGVEGNVCFATFVLEKGDAAPAVCLDLPLAWPAGLRDTVTVLPAERLSELAPA